MMDLATIKKTKIGVLELSSFLGVSKSVQRAMIMTKYALTKIGYKVVSIKLPEGFYDDVRDTNMCMLGNGGVRNVFKDLEKVDEKLMKSIEDTSMIYFAPRWKRNLITLALKYILNKGRVCTVLRNLKRLPPRRLDAAMTKRWELVYKMGELFNKNEIDALITPIIPHCAIKVENYRDLSTIIEYGIIWNLCGNPAATIPITRVKENEQEYTDTYNDSWTKALNKDTKDSEGMPVCVQMVGYNFEDEKLLGIMKMIEREIKFEMEPNQ